MRIAEKTIELNFCAQFNERSRLNLIWFGLTQRQEAKAGFDACVKHGGRLLIFQFKASNHSLKTGERRFTVKHDQMIALRARCRSPRSVFYVFPLVGTTLELVRNPDLLSHAWLLDVNSLHGIPNPTKGKSGVLRKAGIHYVDVIPTRAVIHSDPVEKSLVQAGVFVEQNLQMAKGLQREFDDNFELFWESRRLFLKDTMGVAVLGEKGSK